MSSPCRSWDFTFIIDPRSLEAVGIYLQLKAIHIRYDCWDEAQMDFTQNQDMVNHDLSEESSIGKNCVQYLSN